LESFFFASYRGQKMNEGPRTQNHVSRSPNPPAHRSSSQVSRISGLGGKWSHSHNIVLHITIHKFEWDEKGMNTWDILDHRILTYPPSQFSSWYFYIICVYVCIHQFVWIRKAELDLDFPFMNSSTVSREQIQIYSSHPNKINYSPLSLCHNKPLLSLVPMTVL
jgi:hypothetical protein